MLTTDELLLAILRKAIRDKKATLAESLSKSELSALLDRAEEHKVLPLIFNAICHSPLLRNIDDQIVAHYQKKAIEEITRQIVQTNEFLVMLHDMQECNLDPVVTKGLVCRELYPQPMLRPSVDEDLLVDSNQFKAAHDAIVAYGLTADHGEPDFEEDAEISYHSSDSPLYIELHRELFTPDQEAYGLFASIFTDVFHHTMTINVQDMQVRTLSPSDHLLFLILHAYKHFLYGGVGIRQLCDIGLFAERYTKHIDWKLIRENCEIAGMGKLPAAFFQIIEKDLGISTENMSLPSLWREPIDTMPLLEDILTGGLMGNNSLNRMHSSNITLGAVAAKGGHHHSLAGLLQSLFPSLKYMEGEFGYVKRMPFLLPLGWVHRIYIYMTNVMRSKRLSAVSTLKIGQERLALLKRYGII